KAGVDAAADLIFDKVRDAVVRNVSVGYTVDRVRIVKPKGGEVEQRIVERWTPYEISFVTIGADPGAQTRAGGATYPVAAVIDGDIDLAAERVRCAEISILATRYGLPYGFAA